MRVMLMVAMLTCVAGTAMAGPKEDMLATDKAFSDMSVAKGAHTAFLAYMADDVRLYDGPKPPLLGKAAVAAYYAELDRKGSKHKSSVLEWTPLEADASPDGVLGWTRGTWRFTATEKDGSASKLTGYYVTEWRKEADGKYKFVLDIGGVDQPSGQ